MGARSSACLCNGQISAVVEESGKEGEYVEPLVRVSSPSRHPSEAQSYPMISDDRSTNSHHPERQPSASDESSCPINMQPQISGKSSQLLQDLENGATVADDSAEALQAALLADLAKLAKVKEWGEAELVVLRVLDALPSEHHQVVLWRSISDDPLVQEVLRFSKILLDARLTLAQGGSSGSGGNSKTEKAEAMGFPGWTLLSPVDLGLRSIFPDAPPEYAADINTNASILWRIQDDTLSIKVTGEAPSRHPTLPKSFPLSLSSMFSEADLNEFIPFFTELPQFLEKPRLDFLTWREQARIRFLMAEVSVQQVTRVFTPDGLCVIFGEKLSDANDERCKNAKVPSGYVLSTATDTNFNVLILGEDRFDYVSTVNIPLGGAKVASWILNLLLSWLFPTIIRRMFNAAGSIFTHPAFSKRHDDDETGFYARVLKAEEDGKRRERDTGRRVNMHDAKDRPQQDHFPMGGLAERVSKLHSLKHATKSGPAAAKVQKLQKSTI